MGIVDSADLFWDFKNAPHHPTSTTIPPGIGVVPEEVNGVMNLPSFTSNTVASQAKYQSPAVPATSWGAYKYLGFSSAQYSVLRQAPDASNRFTGDIDIRYKQAKGAASLGGVVSKTNNPTPTAGEYVLDWQGILFPRLRWYDSVGARHDVVSTVQATADAEYASAFTGWVRATLDVDNGASQHVVSFYESLDDGESWTLLDSQTFAGVTSVKTDSTEYLSWNGNSDATATSANGALQEIMLLDGIDGTILTHLKYTDWPGYTGATFSPTVGADFEIYPASGFDFAQMVVIKAQDQDGLVCVTDDNNWNFAARDTALNRLSTDSYAVILGIVLGEPANDTLLVNNSYSLAWSPNTSLTFTHYQSTGSTILTCTDLKPALYTAHVFGFRFNAVTGEMSCWLDGVKSSITATVSPVAATTITTTAGNMRFRAGLWHMSYYKSLLSDQDMQDIVTEIAYSYGTVPAGGGGNVDLVHALEMDALTQGVLQTGAMLAGDQVRRWR